VTERHPEQSSDVVLLLDTFSEARDGSGGTLDAAVRAAAALAQAHLARRDRVALVDFGATLQWLEPAFGVRQLYRLIDALIASEIAFSYAWRAVDSIPRRVLPPGALIIAVTQLWAAAARRAANRSGAARHRRRGVGGRRRTRPGARGGELIPALNPARRARLATGAASITLAVALVASDAGASAGAAWVVTGIAALIIAAGVAVVELAQRSVELRGYDRLGPGVATSRTAAILVAAAVGLCTAVLAALAVTGAPQRSVALTAVATIAALTAFAAIAVLTRRLDLERSGPRDHPTPPDAGAPVDPRARSCWSPHGSGP
jgi:hypothetical protein